MGIGKIKEFDIVFSYLEKLECFSNLRQIVSSGYSFECVGGNKTLALFQSLFIQKHIGNKCAFVFDNYAKYEDFLFCFSKLFPNGPLAKFFSLGECDIPGFTSNQAGTNIISLDDLIMHRVGNFFTTSNDLKYLNKIEPGRDNSYTINVGSNLSLKGFEAFLRLSEYSRTYQIYNSKEYSIRGCIVDFYPETLREPIRIELDGEKVISIRTFSTVDQLSINTFKSFTTHSSKNAPSTELNENSFLKNFDYASIYIGGDNFNFSFKSKDSNVLKNIDFQTDVNAPRVDSFKKTKFILPLPSSFPDVHMPSYGLDIITSQQAIKAKTNLTEPQKIYRKKLFLENIVLNDPVVHRHYGVGRYCGLITIESNAGGSSENVCLEYADGGKIYVPIDKLALLYPAPNILNPSFAKLNKRAWVTKLSKAKKDASSLAKTIVDLYSVRQEKKNRVYTINAEYEKELDKSFHHSLTSDQKNVISDIKEDLLSPYPMNRLLVGDVGFGKTEIILRTALHIITSGYQVVVLAPTTLLSDQHYFTFKSRLGCLGIRVSLVSRFIYKGRRDDIMNRFASNKIDVLIGTHSILRAGVFFKKMGLIVIDEEHRFGVKQKNKLLTGYPKVDYLTISATPLPRTLQKSLSGYLSASTLSTAPPGRLPIATFIKHFDYRWVARALQREVDLGGSSLVVQNNIDELSELKNQIEIRCEGSVVDVIHGKLSTKKLENAFLRFYTGKTNILCGTTILESGLDIPNVNTIIVCDAQKYGLAQLHQLRGRVGRSNKNSQCFLSIPKNKPLSQKSHERLKTIVENWELGSGFAISQKDLEMRGPGEIFGTKQSGNIQNIGYSLFVDLLSGALGDSNKKPSTSVFADISQGIPASYIEADSVRLGYYARIVSANSVDKLKAIQAELIDRFGALFPEIKNLLIINAVKLDYSSAGVSKINIFRDSFEIVAGIKILRRVLNYIMKNDPLASVKQNNKGLIVFKENNPSIIKNIHLVRKIGEHLSNTNHLV